MPRPPRGRPAGPTWSPCGNENLGKAGAVLVAHENVRKRMSTGQFIRFFNRTVPASPAAALPLVTFAESVAFHVNGEDIDAVHVPPAHTDGDVVVWFHRANVVHAGDNFFNGMYPVCDLSSGGSVEGMIGAADRILAIIVYLSYGGKEPASN